MGKDAIAILKKELEQILETRKVKADQMKNLGNEYIELTEHATKFKNAILKLEK